MTVQWVFNKLFWIYTWFQDRPEFACGSEPLEKVRNSPITCGADFCMRQIPKNFNCDNAIILYCSRNFLNLHSSNLEVTQEYGPIGAMCVSWLIYSFWIYFHVIYHSGQNFEFIMNFQVNFINAASLEKKKLATVRISLLAVVLLTVICRMITNNSQLNNFKWISRGLGFKSVFGIILGRWFQNYCQIFQIGQVFELFDILYLFNRSFLSILLHKAFTHFVICETY